MNFLFFCTLKQTRGLFYSSSQNNCVLYTDGVVINSNGLLNHNINFALNSFCIFTSSENVFLKIAEFSEQYAIHTREIVIKCKRHKKSIEKCFSNKATVFTTIEKRMGVNFFVLKLIVGVSTTFYCKTVEMIFNTKDRTEMLNVLERLLDKIIPLTGTFFEKFERGNSESSITHHDGYQFDIYINLFKCNNVNNFAIFYQRSIMFLEEFSSKFEFLTAAQCKVSVSLEFLTSSWLPIGLNSSTNLILFYFELNNVKPIVFEIRESEVNEIMVSSYEFLNKKIKNRTILMSFEQPVQESIVNDVSVPEMVLTEEIESVSEHNNNVDCEYKKTYSTFFIVICTVFFTFLSFFIVTKIYFWLRRRKY